MHSKMKAMQPSIRWIVILCVLTTSVECRSRVASSCVQCDSAIEDQQECGFVKSSESGTLIVDCDPALGCFTQIYQITESAYPGWYTSRGCVKETTTCSGDNCQSCEAENNCNKEVFPTDRHKCHKCNSGKCDSSKTEYCSVYLPNAKDCVTLFESDGRVLLKTCYADLPDSTREFCDDKTNLDCKKCSGDSCNKDSQRDGTKCHQCSGSDCLIINTASTLVDCRSSCYVGINSNGEPVRGCSSNFANTEKCSKNADTTAECFICDGDGCNAIIYPLIGRLQCHTCVNGDCEPSEDNIEYCTKYQRNEKCASIFAENSDVVIARGCISTLETLPKDTCEKNSSSCLKCTYDKCNKDDSKFKMEYCIGCSSEDDSNCLKANSMLEKRCLTNQCFTRLIEQEDKNFGRHMERGCLADLVQVTECLGPDCISCAGKNCNNKLFPANRISCKSCRLDACKKGAVDKICSQYVTDEGCMTFYGDQKEVIYRDCVADAPEGTREVCGDESNLECTKCKGNLCNTDIKRRGAKCYKCQGVECVNPTAANQVECLSECYVGLNEKGEPVRDCANAIANSSACGKTDSTCLTCDDDGCNAIVYPTVDRLTCVKCLGEDCENLNTVSEYCERLHPNERCVTVFDANGDVKERGCISTVQNSAACSSSASTNCLKCGFDECNVEASIEEKYRCVSCNSKEDPKCVSNANDTSISACRTNLCYMRLLSKDGIGQHIERGCAADVQCTATSCSTCSGERCNSNKFPTDRHSCFYCSGDHCSLGHLHEKQCTVYSQQNTDCITVFGTESEVIYRDCFVDAVDGTREVCNDKNDLACSTCTGKLCNSDTKRRGTKCFACEGTDCFNAHDPSNSIDCPSGGCYVGVNGNGDIKRSCASAVSNSTLCVKNDTQSGSCLVCEGDFCNGIAFPMKNRLICKECQGQTCEDETLEDKYCERIYVNETCVSVFNNANKILERGCSTTVQNNALCSASNPNCLKCAFTRCNVQTSKQELNHCVSCDSRFDMNCVTNSSSISTKACLNDQCYSRILTTPNDLIWQHVEKGCVSDLQNPSTCTGSICLACVGDRCNNILYPTDRFSCLTCRGNDCKLPTVPSHTCGLYNRQRQACITLYDQQSQVVYRGCYSDTANGTREVCDDASQLICTKCTSKNCNSDNARRGKKCFKCQGLNCFVPNNPADVVDCLSNCYMGVNQQGESVKDCQSAITNTTACGNEDNGVNRCNVCADDYCNGVQFPIMNRLQCHTCNEENCKAGPDNIEYCQRYHAQERCVTIFSKADKVIERGCSSSLKNKRYCDQNYQNCLQCPSGGCNNITSKVERLCVVCNSAIEPGCVLNPSVINSTKYCRKGCFTKLLNGIVSRGCYEDLGENFECVSDNKCKYCNDADKCNVESYPNDRRSCRTCVGVENCRTNSVSRSCLKYKENESCVTIFDGYRVTRKGCLSDVPSASQVQCSSSSSPLCISCSSRDNCNIETVRTDEKCVVCNSALDPNCAQKPSEIIAQQCPVLSDGQCFTRIVNGATARGCKGLLPSNISAQCTNNTVSSQCTITTGEGSNNIIVPQNRWACYHCDSRVDPSCSETPSNDTKTLPCKKYFPPESCLKLVLSDGGVVKGCQSDFSSDICEMGTCYQCTNERGCNKASIQTINVFCLTLTLVLFLRSMCRF